MDLTSKQQLFVSHYVDCWNGTLAAERAGYKGDRNTLGVVAHQNLRNPKIAAAIEQHIESIMPAGEVLTLLADQARGSMADFIDVDTNTLDLQKAAQAGKLHLVKKFTRVDTETSSRVSIEIHDAQSALGLLGKHHGLFKEVIDVHFNPGELTDEQLARIAAGEDPQTVIRNG